MTNIIGAILLYTLTGLTLGLWLSRRIDLTVNWTGPLTRPWPQAPWTWTHPLDRARDLQRWGTGGPQ